jgi:hypothetical protein
VAIPRVPAPGVALVAALALALVALKAVVPLDAAIVWAAILAFLAAVFLWARGRVGVKRAAALLVLGLGLVWFVCLAIVSLLMLLVFGGPASAALVACVLVGLAGRGVYLVAGRADRPSFEAGARAPGLPLLGAALTSVALLSYGGSAQWEGRDFVVAGLTLWSLAGLIWLAKLFLVAARGGYATIRPHLVRWLVPSAVGVAGLLFSVSGVPFLVRFELSRPAIEDAARRVQAGEVEPNQEVSLGLFGDRRVRVLDDGYLEFYLGRDAGWFLGDDWYLVWIPAGTKPPDALCTSWEHVDGPWWLMSDDLWCEF